MADVHHHDTVATIGGWSAIIGSHVDGILLPLVLDLVGLNPIGLGLGNIPVLLTIEALVAEIPHIVHRSDPRLEEDIVAPCHGGGI